MFNLSVFRSYFDLLLFARMASVYAGVCSHISRYSVDGHFYCSGVADVVSFLEMVLSLFLRSLWKVFAFFVVCSSFSVN